MNLCSLEGEELLFFHSQSKFEVCAALRDANVIRLHPVLGDTFEFFMELQSFQRKQNANRAADDQSAGVDGRPLWPSVIESGS